MLFSPGVRRGGCHRWLELLTASALLFFPVTHAWSQATLHVKVADSQDGAIPAAQVLLTATGASQATEQAATGLTGEATLTDVVDGNYLLQVVKPGFFPGTQAVTVKAGTPSSAEFIFRLSVSTAQNQTVNVTAQAEPPAEEKAAAPPAQVGHDALQELPVPNQQVIAALPLVPGVVRTGDGQITLNGARETENSVLINDADATDPATGKFTVSLPLDVVDEVQVFQAPFLGEYGEFTGGVTKIDTRGGGETWKYDFNDFLPEPRFRSGSIFGMRGLSPRLRVSGPLIPHKLYLSEGATYSLDKAPVRGLPFPHNLVTNEGKDSFTQLDYVAGPSDLVNLTLNVSPDHIRHQFLDLFLPEQVTPDLSQNNEALTLTERHATAAGGMFENLIEIEEFHTAIWPQGNLPMVLSPAGDSGNFFSSQNRRANRVGWQASYAWAPKHKWGTHQFKVGTSAAETGTTADYHANPIEALRSDGTLQQQITFTGGSDLRVEDTESTAYAQDEWLVTPRLSIDLSARFEHQSIARGLDAAPRFGFSYAFPRGWVLRGGAGIFYDRLPLNVAAFEDYPDRTVTTYALNGVTPLLQRTYPNILTDFTVSPKASRFLPGGDFNYVPYNETYNLEVEKHLGAKVMISTTYLNSHTRRQFVVNPESDALGDLAISLSNSGNMRYQKAQIVGRWDMAKDKVLNVSYVYSQARGDLNDFDSIYGDNRAPLIHHDQYGPLPSDVPNRLVAWGNFHLPMAVNFSPIYDVHNGFPYSVLDDNWLFVGKENSQRFPLYSDLDFTLTKDTTVLKKYGVRYGFDIYNAFSHFNPVDVQNHIGSPQFGTFLSNQYRYFEPELDFIW